MAASSTWRASLVAMVALFVFSITSRHKVVGENVISIDLSGDGCDRLSEFHVGDNDIADIYHRVVFNTLATRDNCYVTLKTDPERRLEYVIEEARFEECGITIQIYDSPSTNNVDPLNTVSCSTGNEVPIIKKSRFNVLTIDLRKTDVQTDNFRFRMRVINDRGPNIQFRGDDGRDVERDPLAPGVIVGIAIAGVIIIIALVLLAIYLCIRARNDSKDHAGHAQGESSVYTSGNSQQLFANSRYPTKRYGSTEDIRSTTSSQEKTNGAYSNTAYSADAFEKKSYRTESVGRSRGKTSFANESYEQDNMGVIHGDRAWNEDEDYEVRIGSFRKSRKDSFKEKNVMKSAMKKREPPSEIEMSKVNKQPINSILKKRTKSPNRSQTSSTEGSVNTNAMVYGYNRSTTEHPNVKHKPVLERRRSRSGTRSNRSGSSGGYSSGRRSQSADRKQKPKPNARMYGEVFIEDNDRRARSNSRSRARSNSTRSRRERGSESVDSESSATSSRRVSMNPGGKRVHIKGEETDI